MCIFKYRKSVIEKMFLVILLCLNFESIITMREAVLKKLERVLVLLWLPLKLFVNLQNYEMLMPVLKKKCVCIDMHLKIP